MKSYSETTVQRVLKSVSKTYKKLPKFFVRVHIKTKSRIKYIIGGATQIDNINREVAKLVDAFGGSYAERFDRSSIVVCVCEGKKILAKATLAQMMG